MDFDAVAGEVARANEGGRWAEASAILGQALVSNALPVEDEARALDAAIEQLLLLLERGELSEAGHLAYDLSSWLEGPREGRLVYGERRAQFVAMRELFDLGPAFPEQVRTVIARGLRTGDLLTAHRQLATLVDTAPSDAALAHQRLERDAATLFGLFGGHLVEDPNQSDAATRSFTTMLALAAAMLGLFFVIRTPHKAPKSGPDASTSVVSAASSGALGDTNVAAHESAKTTASTLGQTATQKSAYGVASAADRVRLALGRRDCKDAQAALVTLRDAIEKANDPALRTSADRLEREVTVACTP